MGPPVPLPRSLMKAYFLRRLLLVPITMIGVTLLVFSVTRIVPGGPVVGRTVEAAGLPVFRGVFLAEIERAETVGAPVAPD